MKKAFLRKGIGILYGTWWGAFAFFVAVAVALDALQMLSSGLADLVPWPKGVHICILLVLWANVAVASIVSACRREFNRAAGQVGLAVVGFFVFAIAAFFCYCVPTRMTTSPVEEWIQEYICKPARVERSQLVFLGGISCREPEVVFEVLGEFHPGDSFVPAVAFGGVDKASMGNGFRHLVKMCRIAVELPEEFDVYDCHEVLGSLRVFSAGGKTYLVYRGL